MTSSQEREPPPWAPGAILVVEASEEGLRADRFLQRRLPGLGRREAARLFVQGGILLERPGHPPATVPKGRSLRAGDRLRVEARVEGAERAEGIGLAATTPPVAEPVPGVEVVYQDDSLVVLGKPAGVPSHPLEPDETGTLANHLAALYPAPGDLGGPAREAGLVHRLDTLTSGLLVAARTPAAYAHLRRQFQEHRVDKTYLALVAGTPPVSLRLESPIESRRGRRKVSVGRGQTALTEVALLERYDALSLVEARTRFGRRHQVRAHLACAGFPLVGDPLYGPSGPVPEGPWPLLHASTLGFAHPVDGRHVALRLPLPEAVQAALAALAALAAPKGAPHG